jgi:hypothetical protein
MYLPISCEDGGIAPPRKFCTHLPDYTVFSEDHNVNVHLCANLKSHAV